MAYFILLKPHLRRIAEVIAYRPLKTTITTLWTRVFNQRVGCAAGIDRSYR